MNNDAMTDVTIIAACLVINLVCVISMISRSI